jgi:hypothetical protein
MQPRRRDENPYRGQTLQQGHEGGEASALASNGWRVMRLGRHVKDLALGARSALKRQVRWKRAPLLSLLSGSR